AEGGVEMKGAGGSVGSGGVLRIAAQRPEGGLVEVLRSRWRPIVQRRRIRAGRDPPFRLRAFDPDSAAAADIRARGADQNLEMAALHLPGSPVGIVESEGAPIELEPDVSRLAGLQPDLLEAFQLLVRPK